MFGFKLEMFCKNDKSETFALCRRNHIINSGLSSDGSIISSVASVQNCKKILFCCLSKRKITVSLKEYYEIFSSSHLNRLLS